jgi:hypothetical protein
VRRRESRPLERRRSAAAGGVKPGQWEAAYPEGSALKLSDTAASRHRSTRASNKDSFQAVDQRAVGLQISIGVPPTRPSRSRAGLGAP